MDKVRLDVDKNHLRLVAGCVVVGVVGVISGLVGGGPGHSVDGGCALLCSVRDLASQSCFVVV